MVKLKGLGKGLDALLAATKVNVAANSAASSVIENFLLRDIGLFQIQVGKYQPRRIFAETELQELADSIKHNGVIQPIVVRQLGAECYELIAGERRWRACQLAGLARLPAIVRQFSDEEALAISMIENIQRKDLNVVEEAYGYRRLIDEFGLTHEALATVTGKSRSSISNTLRMLNLSQQILDLLLECKLDMGHARALLPLPIEQQLSLAEEIMHNQLTTAAVENKVSKILHQLKYSDANQVSLKNAHLDSDISRLAASLADRIGMLVGIKHHRSGTGKITINYASLDELEGFLQRFTGHSKQS